jgi:predicted transcriptional regulator
MHKRIIPSGIHMRLPNPITIKKMRERLSITQSELAKEAGVSQSLIARIESGKVDPRYSKIEAILKALDEMCGGVCMAAKDLMNKKVLTIDQNSTVKDAAYLMKKNNISQLPVLEGEKVVGSITEASILNEVAKGMNPTDLSITTVKDIMNGTFPIIDPDTPLHVISFLLEYNQAVLIKEKGELKGIICKSDLLKLLR